MIFAFLIGSSSLFAQTTWQRVYSFPGYAIPGSVIQTKDSAYVAFGNLGNSILIFKVDQNGNNLWSHFYSYVYSEGHQIIENYDGTLTGVGTLESPLGANQLALWKFRASGETIWTKTFGWQGQSSHGIAISQTSDKGFVAVGSTGSIYQTDIYVVKVDSFGHLQWQKIFGDSGPTEWAGDVIAAENYYLILGCYVNYNTEYTWLLYLDQSGNLIQERIYNLGIGALGRKICQVPDGYIITGSFYTPSQRDMFLLLKTDTLGYQQWYRTYNAGPDDERAKAGFSTVNNDGYWIVGTKDYPGQSSPQVKIWVVRTNLQGETLFTRTFSHLGGLGCKDAKLCFDGGVVITAFVYSGTEAVLIKTDQSGNVGLCEEAEFFLLSQTLKIFPNPSTGLVNFQLPNGQSENLKIYDASGRQIKEVEVKNQLKLKLPAGIYFYRFQTEKRIIQTGKIVILGSN